MQRRRLITPVVLSSAAACLGLGMARAGQDSASNWAGSAVQAVVANGVMGQAGSAFNGDDLVTHAQAAIAMSRLAKAVLAGAWHTAPSKTVPISALKSLHNANWKARPITRYAFAYDLAHVGNYMANGLQRAPAGARDLAKSVVLPTAKVTASPGSPAYDALTYLAKHRMLTADSALLKGDSRPLRGSELAADLAALVDGVTDAMTPLGLDNEGNTPDVSFHKKRGAQH